jgi:predicted RNase H-like HicB family nuclease
VVDLPRAVLYDGTSENLRGESRVKFQIEVDREEDGRWIAEITTLPGVLAYGKSKQEAIAKVKALALRMLADEIEKEKKDRPLDISIACCP